MKKFKHKKVQGEEAERQEDDSIRTKSHGKETP
jgi:hypothetical protein